MDRAILELPSLYRAVVVLRDLEELSTEETAQILDVSADVVKTRLRRGRVALRQKLDCYVHNHCLEEQPSPDPSPLTGAEREELTPPGAARFRRPRRRSKTGKLKQAPPLLFDGHADGCL